MIKQEAGVMSRKQNKTKTQLSRREQFETVRENKNTFFQGMICRDNKNFYIYIDLETNINRSNNY